MDEIESHSTFYLIPKESLDELIQAVKDLRLMRQELEQKDGSGTLGDYIPEERAMEIMGRGKTWFWNKRKSGELIGKKAAGRWYYSLDELKKLINNGQSSQ